ncbi:unnamed protein product, partial [Iphiclides podalirius]
MQHFSVIGPQLWISGPAVDLTVAQTTDEEHQTPTERRRGSRRYRGHLRAGGKRGALSKWAKVTVVGDAGPAIRDPRDSTPGPAPVGAATGRGRRGGS